MLPPNENVTYIPSSLLEMYHWLLSQFARTSFKLCHKLGGWNNCHSLFLKLEVQRLEVQDHWKLLSTLRVLTLANLSLCVVQTLRKPAMYVESRKCLTSVCFKHCFKEKKGKLELWTQILSGSWGSRIANPVTVSVLEWGQLGWLTNTLFKHKM